MPKLTFTTPEGATPKASKTLELKLTPARMISKRVAGASWWKNGGGGNAAEGTVAFDAGVPKYPDIEFIRRSPEFAQAATEHAEKHGLVADDATLKQLGCLPPERKPKASSKRGGITSAELTDVARDVIAELTAFVTDGGVVPDDRHVTKAWVEAALKHALDNIKKAALKQFPELPAKPTPKTKAQEVAELKAQIAELTAQLAAPNDDDGDAE